MNLSQIIAVIILVLQAVVAYLLSQTDVTFEGVPKVFLGAASVSLSVLALYLKVQLPGRDTTS